MARTVIEVETLGELLRTRRGEMTQRELADRVGVTFPTISRFETGHRMPTLATMAKLADALAFSPEDWISVREFMRGGE